MVLPGNGRIIIVDDQIEQALPLIKYLSINKLPFKYFSGEVEDLPLVNKGFDDIRIIFLDLNLVDDRIPERPHFAKLKGVLNRIINKVTHPYLLVAWTRHEEHLEELNNYVFDNKLDMDQKKPFHIICANKISFFDLDGTEQPESDYKDLKVTLEEQLSGFSELECLFKWENLIHRITNEISSDFFPPEIEYSEWAEKTRSTLNTFAIASIGRHYDSSDVSTKVNAAFEVINQLFMDKLETAFYSQNHTLDLSSSSKIDDKYKMYINSKLLTGTPLKKDTKYPGSVVPYVDDELKGKIFNKIFLCDFKKSFFGDSLFSVSCDMLSQTRIDRELEDYYQKNNIDISKLERAQKKECRQKALDYLATQEISAIYTDLSKAAQSEYSKNAYDNAINACCLIEVCIDPLCDYVQNKSFYPKIVKGLLIEGYLLNLIDSNSEAIYISPKFENDGKEVILVLDYRYLKTLNEDECVNTESIKFRLRSTLLADIQSKLSRHVNRQGILYL
ncbi:hypothetical protein ABFP25_13520 [Acinetobacter indicus]|uniref:hypothetical protein n=1 Tax=Acinetobacter indicus TaxID=756892 RepID=UPI00321232E8